MTVVDTILDNVDSLLEWVSNSLHQTIDSYCQIETADDPVTLVSRDGSLLSVIEVAGVTELLGDEEYQRLLEGLQLAWQTQLTRGGHAIQILFNYDRDQFSEEIEHTFRPAQNTATRLGLDLEDVFAEKKEFLSRYCAHEKVYLVLWTRPGILSKEQYRQALKEKAKAGQQSKVKPVKNVQNILATIPDLRDTHNSFVRATIDDMRGVNIVASVMEIHDAIVAIRELADPEFMDKSWRPCLPGDKIPHRKLVDDKDDVSNVLWPPLVQQIFTRDAEVIDQRTVRIGDRIYTPLFIELFPRDVKTFMQLFQRTLSTHIPWRISFWIEGDGEPSMRLKSMIAGILSFAHPYNRLINDAMEHQIRYIKLNTDEAIVKMRVALITWAPDGELRTLRVRVAQLAKAIEGWGSCVVSELSGDPFAGVLSSMLAVSDKSIANASVAPFSQVIPMLPLVRPASPWQQGAMLLRTPDGKLWPYQPGSSQQTTWIDLLYARPGSGKSVLSNAINLAICLAPGIQQIPFISIVDIGPSSSGLISLLKEALPPEKQHWVAYHRLRMTPDYSINPFDTQLGCRKPTAQERAFLVNFLTLLMTPLGTNRPYDGIADMAGMVIDELYKTFSDEGNPNTYTPGVEPLVDAILTEVGFVQDAKSTWWEVTDALFVAGFPHEAMLAQRFAVPLLADTVSVCRFPAIEDLFGKVNAPTGETLVIAFGRMISSAVREYPILSQVTSFDIGEARVVSLDLDEVAKSGGEAADRQTAVMYMLARYVLARHFYLNEGVLAQIPEKYQRYHEERIALIQEVPKRLVYDEFHRTAGSRAVREQVIVDMREGRKWNVQIALISQSVDDFDDAMIEFATSVFIMDAGPKQAINKTCEIFGLSETARYSLTNRVHGPREGGGTFLAQFSTKYGTNTQLLTCTLGPVELWAFSTTSEDTRLRNKLYKRIGPKEARQVLARLYPSGSVKSTVERLLGAYEEEGGEFDGDVDAKSIIDELAEKIVSAYANNPQFSFLPD